MKWFRMYVEIIDDPKLRNVSDKSFRVMIFLFSLAAEADKDGLIPLTEDEIMWRLRIPEKVLTAAISELSDRNIINDSYPLQILNWTKRQYKSDNSSNRVSAYREKRKSLGMSKGSNYDTESVLERDSHSCVYCGGTQNLCVDHVLPITQGGTDDDDNLVCACKKCNSGKAGRTPEQAGYQWRNKEACNRYIMFMSRLHETAPDTDTDTDTDKKKIHKEKVEFKNSLFHNIPDALFSKWKVSCPGIDIKREIARAEAWVISNPKLKKSNWERFLTNWMARAQDRARPEGGNNGNRTNAYRRYSGSERRDTELPADVQAIIDEINARSTTKAAASPADGKE